MKTTNEVIKKLADLIAANPKCQFIIDNDYWSILDESGENEIASSDEFRTDTEWYSTGNCYGAALAEAMVEILNRKGFEIYASAV